MKKKAMKRNIKMVPKKQMKKIKGGRRIIEGDVPDVIEDNVPD